MDTRHPIPGSAPTVCNSHYSDGISVATEYEAVGEAPQRDTAVNFIEFLAKGG